MLDLNLLKIGFAILTVTMIILGSLMNTIEKHLPCFLQQTFRYGKFAYQGRGSFLKPINVPKRWFRHFYVFGAAFSTLITAHVFCVYYLYAKPFPWIVPLLDFLGSTSRKTTVTATSAFLALLLLTVQSWHRFYETWFVSVYSDASINIFHYIIGYGHYFGAIMAILCEAPGFSNASDPTAQINVGSYAVKDVIGCLIFLWACYNQYKAAQTLAELRKNKKGQIVTLKYSVPSGGLFELVSSPHLFTEILMYAALSLILINANTWHVVFLWVLSNQVESALLAHWWYQATFQNYPKERKAVIPYIL